MKSPPDAFVIDLSRLPSQGREIAIALRQSPRTRAIPIVFCGGLEEKVSAIRSVLPDAAYCELPMLVVTLQKALKEPPAAPVKPAAMMDRYQGRTVAQKLGIAQGSTIALPDAPSNALKMLGELPAGVEVVEEWTPKASASCASCTIRIPSARPSPQYVTTQLKRKLWILWRKGGKAARGDVTEALVRESALDLGLVDYKVCSVDATWTAMLFARKK